MKKLLSLTKAGLLAATLLVTGLSAFPQVAKATTITITCDGTDNLCATVETRDVIIDFYLGNWTSISITPN